MSSQPPRYWFKRRRYGYGWVPVAWQGWLTLLVFALVVAVDGVLFGAGLGRGDPAAIIGFAAVLAGAAALLLLVVRRTGPTPAGAGAPQIATPPTRICEEPCRGKDS